MEVLYDAECGLCRWAMALAVRRGGGELVPTPIQSERGAALLADLDEAERLRAVRVVRDDGERRTGGAAVADVLGAMRGGRPLAAAARRAPGLTEAAYRLVAGHRHAFGRLIGARARARADAELGRIAR